MFDRALGAFQIDRELALRRLTDRLQTIRLERDRAQREVDELHVAVFELLLEVYRLRRQIRYLDTLVQATEIRNEPPNRQQ